MNNHSGKTRVILGCVFGVLGAAIIITTSAVIAHVILRKSKKRKSFFDNRAYGLAIDKDLKQADPYSYLYDVCNEQNFTPYLEMPPQLTRHRFLWYSIRTFLSPLMDDWTMQVKMP